MIPPRTIAVHHRRVARWARSAVVVAAVGALVVAGCSGDDSSTDGSAVQSGGADAGGSGGSGNETSALEAVASFYPLQFVVEQVGGAHVEVSNLTPAGAEPHDLELTAQDTASLQDADLVVYLSGFAPALDEAVDNLAADQVFDVASAARLDLEGGEVDQGHAGEAQDVEEGDEHPEGGIDPHFWLDPTRLADVADAVAARLGELDPDDVADYADDTATLRGELETLDGEFEAGLASCASTSIVTSHTAFGYLSQRYGLTQVGISGLSPEEEPSPAQLADVSDFVRANDVSTIYYETLVDPAIAETVADETGASTAVLDPIEGLTDQSAGTDYFEVMRSNLQSLRAGQGCT